MNFRSLIFWFGSTYKTYFLAGLLTYFYKIHILRDSLFKQKVDFGSMDLRSTFKPVE